MCKTVDHCYKGGSKTVVDRYHSGNNLGTGPVLLQYYNVYWDTTHPSTNLSDNTRRYHHTMATKYPTMNWELPNTAEAFKIFKQKLLLVCEDNEIKEDNKIARKIMIGIDDEGLKRLNASNLTEEDKEKPAKLWKFFEDQLRVSVNFRIHRLALMQYRQQEGESLDEFVTHARTLGQQCNFEEKDLQERIIELIIASTHHGAIPP